MVQYVADHVPEGLDERPVESIFGQQRDHVQQVKPGGAEMVDVFLQQVRERAIVADKTGKALVIVYMGPVTPEQDLCIDVAENAFVTAGQIRNAVNDSINGRELSVILVTTSLFTGGWLCKPALNGSTSLSSELERNGTFFRLVAKNTGCAFASRHINKFTCKETPLLTEEERARVRYHDIMPTAPSVQQTSKKSELHQDIHKSLQCCFDDLPDFHHFEFDVKYDGWTEMAPRTGRDLSQWAVNTHRERALPDGNHDREHEKWVHDNSHGFQLIGTRFGGIRSSQVHHLKLLVTLERNTCPGDWKGIETGETSRLFNDFLKLSESEISDVQYKLIFDIVEFRASLNKLAQFLAAYHGLSRSNTGESARFWIEPTGKDLVYLGQLNKAFGLIRFLAPPPDDMVSGFALSRGSVQHDFHKVRYWRPSLWLAAAIVGKHSVGSAEWIKRDLFPGMNIYLRPSLAWTCD